MKHYKARTAEAMAKAAKSVGQPPERAQPPAMELRGAETGDGVGDPWEAAATGYMFLLPCFCLVCSTV